MRDLLYKALDNPALYDCVQNMLGARRSRKAIEALLARVLEGHHHETVLDVGCGTGLFTELFCNRYYGVDINLNYLKRGPRSRDQEFLAADARALPFGQERFDLVFTVGVLHHLSWDDCFCTLREMWRVCRREGMLLILDGLIPSNRANVIGYSIAKLDRGPHKLRQSQFEQMIREAIPNARQRNQELLKVFPHEYIASMIIK